MIRYYAFVQLEKIPLPFFFALSLAIHLALAPLLWRKPFSATSNYEPISVSFLPAAKPLEVEKNVTAPPPPSRRQRAPKSGKQLKRAPLAGKKIASAPEKKFMPTARPQPKIRDVPPPPQIAARTEPPPVPREEGPTVVKAPPQNTPESVARAPTEGQGTIFRRDNTPKAVGMEQLLPGLRDLALYNKPIPLNTQDPILAPFTKVIENWIESQWVYPDLAKHYGLQGKVTVEFTVLQNGGIDLLAVVRSSGSNLLDEEAVRAIKAAAPFPPIPRSIATNRLRIIAGFTYLNNRVAFTKGP
jgi:periplasmic protein TonB